MHSGRWVTRSRSAAQRNPLNSRSKILRSTAEVERNFIKPERATRWVPSMGKPANLNAHGVAVKPRVAGRAVIKWNKSGKHSEAV